jgi:hypothetical protein
MNAMNTRTIQAIESALAKIGYEGNDEVEITLDDDQCIVKTFAWTSVSDEHEYAWYPMNTYEAHKLDTGCWMLAHWSEMHSQWQSSDFSAFFAKHNPQAVYCFARSLESLAGDIKTYKSATAAIKSAIA